MHTSMRKLTRIAVLGAIAAVVAVPVLATGASAAEEAGDCVVKVLPNPVPNGSSAQVHIEGTAPALSTVTAFNGATPLVSTLTAADGTFKSDDFLLGAATGITANFVLEDLNGYATGCAEPEGSSVVRVKAAEASKALAFTGSNNTHSFVLIGIAALVVGLVLTVAARRRNKITA